MTQPPRSTANRLIAKLREDLAELARQARGVELTSNGRKKLNIEIANAANELNNLVAELDPRKQPSTVFDPGNPRTIGFLLPSRSPRNQGSRWEPWRSSSVRVFTPLLQWELPAI